MPKATDEKENDRLAEETLIWQFLSNGSPRSCRKRVLESLERLVEYGNHLSIYTVCELVTSNDAEVREKSWAVIDFLISSVSVPDLWRINSPGRFNLLRVRPDEVAKAMDMPIHVLGVLSMSRNGYVRMAAVEQLAKRLDGRELPYIILRLNDWVDQVRSVAVEAINERLTEDYAPNFIPCIPLLCSLWSTSRRDHWTLRSQIERLLSSEENFEKVLAYLSVADRKCRRYVFDVLTSGRSEEQVTKAVSVGLAVSDPAIRFRAATVFLKEFPPEHIRPLLPVLLEDSFAPVRKETLRWIVEKQEENWREQLEAALFNRNGGVRQFAHFYLRDISDVNAIYLSYLSELKNKASNVRCIEIALKELTASPSPRIGKNDAAINELVESFLAHPGARVRAAAYGAMFRLNRSGINKEELVMKALQDGRTICTRQAVLFLKTNPHAVTGERLCSLLQRSNVIHSSKKAVVMALLRLSKWESLLYLTRAAEFVKSNENSDEELEHTIRIALQKWMRNFNESFSAADRSIIDECRNSLARTNILSEHELERMNFLLK